MMNWAKIMYSDFTDHYSGMDDKQIVKDIRKSIEDLTEGNSRGKSFGAFIVKSTKERIARNRHQRIEAGRKGGLAFAAKYRNIAKDISHAPDVAAQSGNHYDQVPIDVSTPTISANDVEPDNVKLDIGQLSQDADIRKDSEDRKSSTSCTFDTEARQDLRTGAAPERVKNQPSSHCGKAPVRSFGESGLVHMTDAQANSLRSYYGEDFDRAVGILENYILSLPSKAEGDEKGEATFWREDYAKRNHYFAMRRDNWVDNALKKAKTADKRLENASNPNYKSFKQQDIDARTEFFSKSIFDGKEAI